jgi:four helix bundle protein
MGEVKIKDKSKKIKVEEKKNDLCERLFEFAVRVIEFLKTLPYTPENKTIRTQLSKSGCSSGANYEEAQSGSSKADFANKVRISLREMRESNYWLRIIKRTVIEVNISELDFLIKESEELKKILGSIVQKSR